MNKALIALVFVSIWLAGCASTRLVDNQVSSFAPTQVAAGASYRFERLPSQQADSATQERLEAMAAQALEKVGLKRQEAAPDLLVQVTATQREEQISTDGRPWGWRLGWHPRRHGGLAWGGGTLFPGLDARPNYWREVHLLIRSTATQAVVFESRASHDGPWGDGQAIFPAIFEAALQGFPNPPSGPRRVDIEIAR